MLRASAIVIIVTGLNDVVAGALPRYEPFYLYLAATALVVFLDGVLVGLFGALLALGAYALMFRPADPILPAGEAFAVLIVAGLVRWLIRRRRRDPTPEVYIAPAPQMLLPAPPPVQDNTEVLTAIDVLRADLQESLAELTRIRETRSDTSGLEAALEASRAEVEVYASERKRMQEYLDRARAGEEAERSRLGELRTRIEELESAERTARGELDQLRGDAESERAKLVAQADALQRRLDAARAEREQVETAGLVAREEGASLAGRVTELELALSVARAADAERTIEIEGLHRALDAEHSRAIALSGDVNDERTKIASLLGEIELERGRVTAERALRERLELDAATRDEESQRLRVRIDELEQGLAEASDVAAAEAAELRKGAEVERERADAMTAEHQRLETEFDQKLQTIVGHLAADHEADMGKAMEEREEARAEARSASLKMSVVQKKMEEERTAITVRLREADERHKRALEDSSRLLSEMRTAALKEIQTLRGRIAQLENAGAAVLPATVTSPTATSAAATLAEQRPRILIVYPDAELRTNARGLLERAGYDVISAADGLEAMRMAIAQKPRVVIADAVMPKMNGRELCQLLKSQEKTASIRVILLTRAVDDPPHGDFPADEVLRKPVPLETLKTTLATLLGT